MTTETKSIEPGVHKNIPIEDYIADRAISNSDLHKFSLSPRQWLERRTEKPTKATIMGTAFHTCVLEPDKFTVDYVVLDPKEVCPTALVRPRGSKKWKEAEASLAPKIALTLDEYKMLLSWRDAVFAHPAAGKLISEQVAVEETICWERANDAFPQTQEASYLCITRPDFRTKTSVVNLKSAASVKQFGFSRKDNGYDLDIGWSLEGCKANGIEASEYRWIVLFKDSLEVAVIRATADDIRSSQAQINAIWPALCEAMDHGVVQPRYPGEVTLAELQGREEVEAEEWGSPE